MSMSASNIDFSIDCLCIRMQWKIGKFAGLPARVAGPELFIFLVKVERRELARTCSAPSLVMRSFWAKRKLKIEKFMITGEEERKTEAARKSLRPSQCSYMLPYLMITNVASSFYGFSSTSTFPPFFCAPKAWGKIIISYQTSTSYRIAQHALQIKCTEGNQLPMNV